jgi:CRP-like cAMP-binding protein
VLKYANSDLAANGHSQANATSLISQLDPPLLKGLAGPEIELIVAAAARRKCRRGQVLAEEGQPAQEFFMILRGRTRYFTLTRDGRRVLLLWKLPGETFGGMTLLHFPSEYLVSTVAARDCELLVWNRPDIRRLVARYPRLLENGLLLASDYLKWYMRTQLVLISHSASQRLALELFHLANDTGASVQDGVELDVTNEELADAANITRFSTSRLLNAWERKGVLTKSRNKIILHSSERLFAYTLPRRGTAA